MAGHSPKETDRLIDEAVSAGDANAAVALFEPDAVLVLPGRPAVRGRDEIRQAFAELVATKPTLQGKLKHVVVASDLAHLVVEWRMEGIDPDGKPFVQTGVATDVMRRQPDGTWLYVIDLPEGISTPFENRA
jgi:uncharacterized protein (TIGR02246 family)